MRYFDLPNIPIPLSVVCLGTGGFGTSVAQDDAFRLLDTFVELGGSFADTAHVYADWVQGGTGASERTLGAWIRSRGMAGRFAVGTKGGHPKLETMEVSRLAPGDIAQDLNESLDRLQLESVELYWLHRDDPAAPVGEIIDALNEHIRAGRIRAIGASNWSTARLQAAADYATAQGVSGFCASQPFWNLAQCNWKYEADLMVWSVDEEALAWYCNSGVKLIPYSVQANGIFAHPVDEIPKRHAGLDNDVTRSRWHAVQAMSAARGVSPNALALAYILQHPCGGAGIVGSHTVEQIRDSCSAADIDLTQADLTLLEDVAAPR